MGLKFLRDAIFMYLGIRHRRVALLIVGMVLLEKTSLQKVVVFRPATSKKYWVEAIKTRGFHGF